MSFDWPETVKEAKQIQLALQKQVIKTNHLGVVSLVAGVDVGFEDNGKVTRAAVALLSFPSLQLLEKSVVRQATCFPYIPGYLSFREAPAIIEALSQLERQPDLLLCDGQGIAHPRRFGIASHLGVITDIASIGVAKSRLIGQYQEPGLHKGNWSPLTDKDELIGAVLRTRDSTKPLYISIGHKIDLDHAIDYALKCTTKYKLPETTRWAHKLASG